jgi:hypothetical protein
MENCGLWLPTASVSSIPVTCPLTNYGHPCISRSLEIDYTALSLVAPDKVRFKYKLEGHDRGWTDADSRRQAFYNNLEPRNYRFRVIASNNSGVWNETGDTLDFSIAPAYYQTGCFQACCGIALLALLWGLDRYRLYQLAREYNVGLEERVAEAPASPATCTTRCYRVFRVCY